MAGLYDVINELSKKNKTTVVSIPAPIALATGTVKRRTFRFHVCGIAHLPAAEKYGSCAFTQKIHKLCEMLVAKGHHVILYAAEGSDAPCTEFVQTHTLAQIRDAFGDDDYDGDEEIGYEWRTEQFRHDFSKDIPLRRYVRHRTIAEVELRKRSDDFLLLTMGFYHRELAEAIDLYLQCESGIGYYGSFATFRAFESTAVRHFSRGDEGEKHDANGMHYYRVIPNYYRMRDFPFVAEPLGDPETGEPYVVYLGRVIQRKGLESVIEATKRANVRCIIAGQGGTYDAENHTLKVDHVTYELGEKQSFYGYADCEARKKLLGNAMATFTPTYYIEPFCGVSAESQLCGTPVISTDFGAFTDNVEHGRTGFRCCSTNDFVLACKNVQNLDRTYIRKRAKALWSREAVNELYEKWWHDLHDVYLSTVSHDGEEPRNYGFGMVRTETEEIAAGTAAECFRARKPFNQEPL